MPPMKLRMHGKNGVMSGRVSPRTYDLVRDMPGRKKWKDGELYFELSGGNLEYLALHFPDAEVTAEIREEMDKVLEIRKLEREALDIKRANVPAEAAAFPFKKPPYQHQLKAFMLSRDREAFGYFMEMGCVSADTEYLSPTGWKRMDEYDGGPVAQYHPENGTAEFVQPLEYVKKPCSEMYHFHHSRGLDQLVSEEHRMLVINRKREFEVIQAADLAEKHWNTPSGAKEQFETTFVLTGTPGIPLSDGDLRLMVAVMADGSFPSHSPHTRSCAVRLKKERKKIRLRELLNAAGVDYTEQIAEDGFSRFGFKAPIRKKVYDEFFWPATEEQRRLIAEECVHWDGSARKSGASEFFSSVKQSADFIQFCFSSTGRRATVYEGRPGEFEVHAVGTGRTRNFLCMGKVERIPSPDGYKYCFMVPSTFLVFRRNGCTFVSGNTGKTKVGIDNAAYLFANGKIDQILIIAPNGVHTQWITEQLPDHMPDFIEYEATWYESGGTKKVKERLDKVLGTKDKLRIIAQHVESFSYKSGMEFAYNFLLSGRTLVILDESSRIKNPQATRTKNIIKLRDLAPYRRLMSGSPVTKGAEDLYAQFLFLHPDILGFSSFYTFANRYLVMGGWENKQIVGYKNMEELQNRIDGHTLRVLKSDCLDLPERTYTNRLVEMTPEQEKLYTQMRDDFLVELENGAILDAPLAITRLLRLQQILCGHLPGETEASTGWLQIPTNRTKVYMEVVGEAKDHSKILTWCRFRADAQVVAKSLKEAGIGYVIYAGTSEQRTEAIRQFREDPDIRVFIANPATAGIGLNLTVSNVTIWYSLSFDLEQYLQANDRNHRIGQKNPVTYVHLETPNTIDTKLIKSLVSKKNIADMILDIRDVLS